MSTIKIPVKELGRTDWAILVSDGKTEAWLPLSQITELLQDPAGPLGLPTTTAVVLPTWLATDKGLQPSGADDCTADFFGGAS